MPARKYAIERYSASMGFWYRIDAGDGTWPTPAGALQHRDRLLAGEIPGPYRIVRLRQESAAA